MKWVLPVVLGLLAVVVVSGCTQSLETVTTATAPSISSLSELTRYLPCDNGMMGYTSGQSASEQKYYYILCSIDGSSHATFHSGKLYNVVKGGNEFSADGISKGFKPIPYMVGDKKALVHFINNANTIEEGSYILFCGECNEGDDFFHLMIYGPGTGEIAENILTPKNGRDLTEFENICAMDDFNCMLMSPGQFDNYEEAWDFKEPGYPESGSVKQSFDLLFNVNSEWLMETHETSPTSWVYNRTGLERYMSNQHENVVTNGRGETVDIAYVSVNETDRVCVYHNKSRRYSHVFQVCVVRVNDDYLTFSVNQEDIVDFESHEVVSALISHMG